QVAWLRELCVGALCTLWQKNRNLSDERQLNSVTPETNWHRVPESAAARFYNKLSSTRHPAVPFRTLPKTRDTFCDTESIRPPFPARENTSGTHQGPSCLCQKQSDPGT